MVLSHSHSQHRSNSDVIKKMTLAATDEFWHSPIDQDDRIQPSASGDCSSDDDDDDDYMTLPAAHHQLLHKNDDPSFENLNGYDHTQGVYRNYDDDDDDDDLFCRQKLSAVKQQGGGSWLLGFARLANEKSSTTAVTAPPPPQQRQQEDMTPPALVRVPSGSSLESDDSSESSSDDESSLQSSSSAASTTSPKSRGVSFSAAVKVQPIPHSSLLSPMQRRKMFSSSMEVRQNKIRNKREYRHDGCDWRNITEEWEMGVDMVTGELVHPVHDHTHTV